MENIKTQTKRITRIIFLGVKRLNKIKILFFLKDKATYSGHHNLWKFVFQLNCPKLLIDCKKAEKKFLKLKSTLKAKFPSQIQVSFDWNKETRSTRLVDKLCDILKWQYVMLAGQVIGM